MHLVDRFNSSRSTFRRTQLKLREKEKKQRNDIQVATFWKNVQHNEIFCKINEVTVTYYQQKLKTPKLFLFNTKILNKSSRVTNKRRTLVTSSFVEKMRLQFPANEMQFQN